MCESNLFHQMKGYFRTDRVTTLKIFCCYALEDKSLMEGFHKHLRVLELQHVSIEYAHDTLPGMEWELERDSRLHAAHIILLLVSADFVGSPEHYEQEVLPAMERYNKGEARVIPIILRPFPWQETPLGKLLPLPDGGKPATDKVSWKTLDHAFLNAVRGIQRAINDVKTRLPAQQEKRDITPHGPLKSAFTSHDALTQLAQIMQNFQLLRAQITNFVSLKEVKGFSLERCESQYNNLYGDAIVFLATYLPECVSDTSEGFVEMVYKKTTERLRKGNAFDAITVFVTRSLIPPLAQLERLGMQIDACVATLEFYKQRYFANICP